MLIFSGMVSLMVMCFSIVVLSMLPVSLHEKNNMKRNKANKDPFSYLFDVYGD